MCGIAGEFRFDNKAPDADAMARMLARLARRGPDAEGQHADGPVRLGHRRLAIIDLSPRSAQPMIDAASGTALVFNGTIYNYPELRARADRRCGHVFHSDGDTEVILRAYAAVGRGLRRASARHVRVRHLEPRDPVPGARPPRHQAAVLQRNAAAASASPRPRRRCWRRAGSTPASTRWRCITCSPCMRWCRRRARSSTASASSPRAPR